MTGEKPMKSKTMRTYPAVTLLTGLALALATDAPAYPPAPDHQIYGVVRNELGDPVMVTAATITFTAANGVAIAGTIQPGLQPGENYRLRIPMDAGVTPNAYKATALFPNTPFTLKVRIGTVDYVPMEVAGDLRNLGKPAQSTRIDLTLGVDSNQDGLPDAWQRDLIDTLGGGQSLSEVGPNADSDGDGINNWNEYLAGTYAWDAADGFELLVVDRQEGADVLQFLAIVGRSYSISRSADMKTWTPVPFKIPAQSPDLRDFYPAVDVRDLRVQVPAASDAGQTFYYRAHVQ